MSKIDSKLTAERLREVLSYDPETGDFHCLIRRGANAEIGMKAGSVYDGYLRIKIDLRLYRAHRLAWLYMTGEWPADKVDHIDTNRLNNRWINLRAASHSLNTQNQRRAHKNSKTGYLGVSPNGSGFQAGLTFNGRTYYFGTYKTPETAYEAYLAGKRSLHQGNTL